MDKPHEFHHIEWIKISKSDRILNSLIGIQDSLERKNTKINIISYLAEWCPNCHYEALTLRDLYQEYSRFNIRMTLVMNYSDKNKSMNFIELYGLKMNILYGELDEKKEDMERLKDIQLDLHKDFIEVVEKSRSSKLKKSEVELFSGEFWSGRKAKDLGLIDEIGNANQVLREKF